jgi:hypothetical protein
MAFFGDSCSALRTVLDLLARVCYFCQRLWLDVLGAGLYIANFEYRDSRLICNIFGGQSPPLLPFL